MKLYSRDAIWSLLGSSVRLIFSFGIGIYLANFLSVEELSRYALVQSYAIISIALAQSVISQNSTRIFSIIAEKNGAENKYRAFKKKISKISWLVTVFYVVVTYFLGASKIGSNHILLMLLGASMVWLGVECAFLSGVLSGLGEFKVQFIWILASYVCVAAYIAYGYPMDSEIAMGISSIVSAIQYSGMRFFFLKKFATRYEKFSQEVEEPKVNTTFTPGIIAASFSAAVNAVALWLLSHSANGTTEVAFFLIASQWRNFALFVSTSLASNQIRHFSKAKTDRLEYLKNALRVSNWTGALLCFSALATFSFFGKLYGGLLQGREMPFFAIMATGVIVSRNNTISRLFIGCGEFKRAAYFDIIWATSFILIALALTPLLGIYGFIIAQFMSLIFQGLYQNREMKFLEFK